MRRWVLLAAVAVLAVAGIAAAVGAAAYFLPSQQGRCTGPGIPPTVTGNCALHGGGAWCLQGFVVNATSFPTTMCFSGNSTSRLSVWAYLMNEPQYHEFQVNSTLTKLGNVSVPGCVGPITVVSGPGPFYWV